MDTPALLDSIAQFCRKTGMSETTFGRLAVNDGKLVARLKTARRGVWPETEKRIRVFIRGGARGFKPRARSLHKSSGGAPCS